MVQSFEDRCVGWLFHHLFLSLDGKPLKNNLGCLEIAEMDTKQKRCRICISKYIDRESKTAARVFIHDNTYRCSFFSLEKSIPDYVCNMLVTDNSVWNFFLKLHFALLPYAKMPYDLIPAFKKPKFLFDKEKEDIKSKKE